MTQHSTTPMNEDALKWSDVPISLKRQGGLGPVTLTARGVFKLAALGWSARDIASIHGTNYQDIYSHFGDALKAGKYGIADSLRRRLLYLTLQAEKTDPNLLKFALKNLAGLTEEGKSLETDEAIKPSTLNINLKVLNNKADFDALGE